MKRIFLGGTALIATTSFAFAGGLDRSGQGIGAMFEDGSYAEISLGNVSPSVTGVLLGVFGSGNVAGSYSQFGAAAKTDVTDQLSFGLIMDQPFGANVDYSDADAGYPLAGTLATVESTGLTALARYRMNDAFSLHGGMRMVTASGSVTLVAPYSSDYSSGSGTGYVVGAAFEKPEIAMRVALTYSSAIDVTLDGNLANTLDAALPQSINLDFQTGIAADTLIFGSVRWADWSEASIEDSNLLTPLVEYDDDVITYNIGIGRRFSESLSGSISFGYEAATGDPANNLSPTDGNQSVQLGLAYDLGNGTEISGGVRYVMLGDTTTETLGAVFENNSAVAIGLKLSTSF